jgi:UDP-2,3-diacylglucosamine hydrolase
VSATKPVLLASDVHLGATHPDQERAFMAWLEHAADAASWLIINGDLFDFWFEYRAGIPHGYDGVLARLREIVEGGLPVTLMGGNHDWWGGTYLRDEIGVEFLQEPVVREIAGRTTLLAHGDGLGRGDAGYRLFLRPMLRSPLTRFAFGILPVAVGDRIAGHVSNTEDRWNQWGAPQQERSDALEEWATAKLLAERELDLIVLGHTHLPLAREVAPGRWYVNSGDWVFHKSFVTLREGASPLLSQWGATVP